MLITGQAIDITAAFLAHGVPWTKIQGKFNTHSMSLQGLSIHFLTSSVTSIAMGG
jgi:hypothetical protein